MAARPLMPRDPRIRFPGCQSEAATTAPQAATGTDRLASHCIGGHVRWAPAHAPGRHNRAGRLRRRQPFPRQVAGIVGAKRHAQLPAVDGAAELRLAALAAAQDNTIRQGRQLVTARCLSCWHNCVSGHISYGQRLLQAAVRKHGLRAALAMVALLELLRRARRLDAAMLVVLRGSQPKQSLAPA